MVLFSGAGVCLTLIRFQKHSFHALIKKPSDYLYCTNVFAVVFSLVVFTIQLCVSMLCQ